MNKKTFGYLYLVNTVILFSTYEVVSKTLVGKIDPFQINFIRFLVGGIILLLFLILKKDIRITRNDFLWVSVIGALNVVLSMNLLQLSLYINGSKASVVAVIFSSNPIFVAIFSALIDKEKIGIIKFTGMFVGIIGIFVVFINKLDLGAMDYRSPLLSLGSAVLYALYTVIGRKTALRIGSLKMNSYSSILGSLLLLPILLIMKLPVLKFDASGLPQVIYLSVIVTGIAYLTYFMGLSILGASSGSMIFFVKPVLASLIAIVFLNEKPTINLFLGTVLIILGISVVIYSNKLKKYFKSLEEFHKKWRNKEV